MNRWWAGGAALFALAAVLGPLLGDPDDADFAAILAGPSPAHPLGTDQLGRDLLLRLLAGAQLTLGISVVTVLVTGTVGIASGMAAGYRDGPGARILLRTVDVLAALPTVLFGLLAAAVLGPGIGSLLVAVWLIGWTPFARQAYQLTVTEKGRDYVEGAVALGAGPVRVLVRHVARNLAPPLLAHACVRFAATLLTVSGLSFLGLGAAPPTAEWGAMVAEGREYLFVAPHVVLVPSVAVVAVAVLVTVAGRRIVT